MAQYRGYILGQKGEATRIGSKASGLHVRAASWQGAIEINLYERDGVDFARVSFCKHHGGGSEGLIYEGPVSGKQES